MITGNYNTKMITATMNFEDMTKEEKLLHVKQLITPVASYLKRGYSEDVMAILAKRGILNDGKPYTLDQIRHTKAGNLALPELAEVIAEVGRRNKEARESFPEPK